MFFRLSVFLFLFTTTLSAQQNASVPKREYLPVKTTTAPHIDGKLDDACWQAANEATNFVQFIPEFGKAATFDSKVKLLYDDNAIYVGALLLDPEPSKINSTITQRDVRAVGIADHFIVGFDTYHDGINAFRFETSAANSQTDARLISPGTYDVSWDAVWQSSVQITNEGWVVELKIPYSALRFPKKDVQTWGLQFSRNIQRSGEVNAWSPTDPRIDNIVQQWGLLKDLKNIQPPLRLSFSPFMAAYTEHIPISYDPAKFKTRNSVNGGMDVKWGINESFTLDMTLVPDFGQVQSDNTIFNLSPFEVQYEERRPFFTEGTELFNKNNIFYSRRIGGRPAGYYNVENQLQANEEIVKNPNISTLYNATKFSGRTKHGLGIGVLNAVAAPMYATIRNTVTGETRKYQTGVMANQNILVLDQNFKNNSTFTFTNTSVIREGKARDANVSQAALRLNDKDLNHKLTVQYSVSQVHEPSTSNQNKIGTSYLLQFEKLKGTFQYNIGSTMTDSKWDPNDMGIFTGNNIMNNYVTFTINDVRRRKHLQNWNNTNIIGIRSRVKPFSYSQFRIISSFNFTSNQFASYGFSLRALPFWQNDYFEPRVDGMKLKLPPTVFLNPYFSSDSRKKLSYSIAGTFGETTLPNDPFIGGDLTLTWRATKKIIIDITSSISKDHNNYGFVRYDNNVSKVVIGRRNINTVDNSFRLSYSLTPKMTINFRARHYWTKVVYNSFLYLKEDGYWDNKVFENGRDFNFNAFNIDCVYSWQFAPGSFFNLIWKNGITEDDPYSNDGYGKNIKKTLDTPQANSVILKVIYYLEYHKIAALLKSK